VRMNNFYISQGTDFCTRTSAEWENPAFLSDAQDRSVYVDVLQHAEQQTLEQLYGGHIEDVHGPSSHNTMFPQLQTFTDKLNQLRLNTSNTTNALNSFALEEVEQEREVEFQVEEVREVQKVSHYKAHAFPGLHPAISCFVDTGRLCGTEGYENVFDAVSRTSIGKRFDITGIESCLFVSAEFMKTIKTNPNMDGLIDNFLVSPPSSAYVLLTYSSDISVLSNAFFTIPPVSTPSSSSPRKQRS
jgi:hypothetical protein